MILVSGLFSYRKPFELFNTSSEIMNVKVVSGSAAGFHINTVTYRESRSFFFT